MAALVAARGRSRAGVGNGRRHVVEDGRQDDGRIEVVLGDPEVLFGRSWVKNGHHADYMGYWVLIKPQWRVICRLR